MEEWRKIPISRGQYEVSNMGRVRNAHTKHLLSIKQNKNGTPIIHLNGYMKGRSYTIGQLVAMTFMPDEKGRVMHKSKDITDNRVTNLYVVERE